MINARIAVLEKPRQLIFKHEQLKGQRLLFACAQSHMAGGTSIDPRQLDPNLWIAGRSGNRYA